MDLQSIARKTRTVPLGSGTVEITGLSLRKLTELIVRYPDLLALAAGRADLASLVVSAPEAMLAIFALAVVGPTPSGAWWRRRPIRPAGAFGATGEMDHEGLVQAFDEASTGQQIDLLSEVFELTFAGERARPLLEGLVKSFVESPSPPNPSAEATPEPSIS